MTNETRTTGEAAHPETFKDALEVLEGALERHSASGPMADFANAVREASSRTYKKAAESAIHGVERVRETARSVDKEVHRNPWPVIGGMALGTFALGFLLGRRGSRSQNVH
jgi:ElaB/YqjD/DUF883 family membrane-anchored ribosome-binding protein